MRGPDRRAEGLFSYVSGEGRVPPGHPLRSILPVADAALAAPSADFQQLYALNGRPSIPPEKLLRALLLQAFYSVRSERQLMARRDRPVSRRQGSTTTCCSAGSWVSASTTRCGT